MFRYIALAWTNSDTERSRTARRLASRLRADSKEWRNALDCAGLMVGYCGARDGASIAYPLIRQTGVVLGRLFPRRSDEDISPKSVELDANESAKIMTTAGRHLVQHYWGRYVAFLHDANGRTTWTLRDPTGGLPCFVTSWQGIDVYFSSVEDCVRLGMGHFTINWKYIAAHVPSAMLQSSPTALNEVAEIQGGECVESHRGTTRKTFYWDPVRIADSAIIEDPAEAAATLRRTARTCVQAWASGYQSVLLRLSGGLDSSIVLSCLQDAPTRPSVTCLNYYVADSDGDERRFARLAAHRTGCRLIEYELRGSEIRFERILTISKSARPSSYMSYLLTSYVEPGLTGDRGGMACFDGSGGDQLFYNSRVALAASDYLEQHGIRKRFFGIALDVARLAKTSIWSVVGAALLDRIFRRRWDPLSELGKGVVTVNPDVIEAARRERGFLHPWHEAGHGLPNGKFWHLYLLTFRSEYYDPLRRSDDAEPVRPLTSQPLVELCLRVPTYVLTHGGWDRSVARRAFASRIPREIVTRHSKGGAQNYVTDVLRANTEFLRSILLDGLLVQRGLLDRRKLENVLSGKPTALKCAPLELFDHASTEAWLQSWNGLRRAPQPPEVDPCAARQ